MIESIHIKNFRGIQDGKIDRFSKINLLVGPNNSGKSAVLESLYLANTASQVSSLQVQNNPLEVLISERDLLENDPIQLVCDRHLRKFQNGGLPQKLRTRGVPPLDFVLNAPSIPSNGEGASVSLFSLSESDIKAASSFKGGDIYAFHTSLMEGDFEEYYCVTSYRTIYFWEKGLTYFQKSEAKWAIKGLKPWASHTLFYDVQNTLRHLPFEFFRKMMVTIPGWTQKIGRRFGKVFDLTKQFNVNFFQPEGAMHLTQGFISPEDKIALTIDDYGDGSRSAFKLLTPLIALSDLAEQLKPGVLLWEEPELFQNPRTLGTLLEEIALLIKDKPVQLFIATHSLDVIAQFTSLAESGQIDSKDLMTFRLNLQEGQLTSSWFNVDNLKAWMEEGLDPRVWGEFKSPLQFTFQEDGE